MSKAIITQSHLTDIGDAIRAKLGVSTTYTPGQMAAAIQTIPDPSTLVSKTITANGTYDPQDDDADGYSSVTVAVPQITVEALVATENGTYTAPSGKAYSPVTVNVSGGGGNINGVNFDFTQMAGVTLGNVTMTSAGASFSENSMFGLGPFWPGGTIEIDVGTMSLSSGSHRRFVMINSEQGFIYRSNGKWSLYATSWAIDSNISDGSFFDNSTCKIVIDANNYWHIYKNDVLVYEPDRSLSGYSIQIGATSNGLVNTVITGARIHAT